MESIMSIVAAGFGETLVICLILGEEMMIRQCYVAEIRMMTRQREDG